MTAGDRGLDLVNRSVAAAIARRDLAAEDCADARERLQRAQQALARAQETLDAWLSVRGQLTS